MSKYIGLVLALVVIVVGVNDGWRWSTAQQNLTRVTDDLTYRAAELAGDGQEREVVAGQLASEAASHGVVIYQYGQTPDQVQVWTQATVKGTIVTGPASALLLGVPFREALKSPLVIKDFQTAGPR